MVINPTNSCLLDLAGPVDVTASQKLEVVRND